MTAQSQCPGALPGPDSPLIKSILALNNSGTNSTNETTLKLQGDNKSNTNEGIAQPTIRRSNMTMAENVTKSSRPSLPFFQSQTPNTIPSNILDGIFQRCFISSTVPIIRSTLSSGVVAAMEKDAIKNMSAPIPFQHITNNSTFNQEIHDSYAKTIRPNS